jgi:uncharacterized protein
MKILRSQLEPLSRQIHYQGSLAELGIDDLGDPSTPVKVGLVAVQENEVLRLTGRLSTSIIMTCDRCLQGMTLEIEGDLDITLVSEISVDGQDGNGLLITIQENDTAVDLRAPLRESIYLEIPVKRLCRADCKGLCPTCGTNFNNQSCSCGQAQIDARWAPLLGIKEKLEKA